MTDVRAAVIALLLALVGCGQDEPSVFETYGLDWMKDGENALVIRSERPIGAPAERVWERVARPNDYGAWSTTISASVGELAPGATIMLVIQLGDPPVATESSEVVGVVDAKLHALSWKRDLSDLGGPGQWSERWQVVVPEGSGARYYTAIRFSEGIGPVVVALLGAKLRAALDRIGEELAAAP